VFVALFDMLYVIAHDDQSDSSIWPASAHLNKALSGTSIAICQFPVISISFPRSLPPIPHFSAVHNVSDQT
jgi:hypothetical protein